MKKAIITLSLICVGLLSAKGIENIVFAQELQNNTNATNFVQVQTENKLTKEQAQELLKEYNPSVNYIYQGTENEFEALQEKGLQGYVYIMDVDTDLGMFVDNQTSKIYYFHPDGYLELAQ